MGLVVVGSGLGGCIVVVVGFWLWVLVCCGFFGGGRLRFVVGFWVFIYLFGFCGWWFRVLIWGGFVVGVVVGRVV